MRCHNRCTDSGTKAENRRLFRYEVDVSSREAVEVCAPKRPPRPPPLSSEKRSLLLPCLRLGDFQPDRLRCEVEPDEDIAGEGIPLELII